MSAERRAPLLRNRRRYIVKGYTGSPGGSGCTFAHSCTTFLAAKRCFEKFRDDFQHGRANADVILLIDRQEREVLDSVGTDDPVKIAEFCGW